MLRKRIGWVLFFFGVGMGAARADPATSRRILEESLHTEQTREEELRGLAKHDRDLAKEIDRFVEVRRRYAEEAEARVKRMKDELNGIWPHNSMADQYRAALAQFVKTEEEFARNDRKQTEERKRAEDILLTQAKGAEEGAANHRRYEGELKSRLAALK
jgi:hypothetical protein